MINKSDILLSVTADYDKNMDIKFYLDGTVQHNNSGLYKWRINEVTNSLEYQSSHDDWRTWAGNKELQKLRTQQIIEALAVHHLLTDTTDE